jgi:hypothetical protein
MKIIGYEIRPSAIVTLENGWAKLLNISIIDV